MQLHRTHTCTHTRMHTCISAAQAEPVVDYLTRYSGLHPGDLDPSVSRHHITTMKAAYLQLRQLVDAGCRFVGHGLQKDFEMINVVVPPDQIVDTVDLFYLPGSRRISLRFLAWHLLGQQMSNRLQDTHDSIEDARTALQLYAKYRELSAKGTLQETINNLHAAPVDSGACPRCNWRTRRRQRRVGPSARVALAEGSGHAFARAIAA